MGEGGGGGELCHSYVSGQSSSSTFFFSSLESIIYMFMHTRFFQYFLRLRLIAALPGLKQLDGRWVHRSHGKTEEAEESAAAEKEEEKEEEEEDDDDGGGGGEVHEMELAGTGSEERISFDGEEAETRAAGAHAFVDGLLGKLLVLLWFLHLIIMCIIGFMNLFLLISFAMSRWGPCKHTPIHTHIHTHTLSLFLSPLSLSLSLCMYVYMHVTPIHLIIVFFRQLKLAPR